MSCTFQLLHTMSGTFQLLRAMSCYIPVVSRDVLCIPSVTYDVLYIPVVISDGVLYVLVDISNFYIYIFLIKLLFHPNISLNPFPFRCFSLTTLLGREQDPWIVNALQVYSHHHYALGCDGSTPVIIGGL